jgi:hypothetical protein
MDKTDVIINKPICCEEDINYMTLEQYLFKSFGGCVCERIISQKRVIVHGMEMDLSTPISFLYSNFSYMDNFLYISLINKE